MENDISLQMFRQQNDYGYFNIVQIKKKNYMYIYKYVFNKNDGVILIRN